jgi:molybdate transport system substrate-binding protein
MITVTARIGRALGACVLALLFLAGAVHAAELKVMSSGGLTAAFQALIPAYEKATGNKVELVLGPSMGTAPEAIPIRLERGERADVLLMVGTALDDLAGKGKVVPDSRVDVANSKIAMAVRADASKPDIGTLDGFKQVLVAAKSIAYSDSASGV